MTNPTRARAVFCVVVGCTAFASAGDIQLGGSVHDAYGAPLSGIVVSLDAYGLSDTTDAAGRWQMQAHALGLKSTGATSQARWNGHRLVLDLTASATVGTDAFDALGNRVGGIAPTRLESGVHDLPVVPAGSAAGVRWLRLSVDGRIQILSSGPGSSRSDRPGPGYATRSLADSNAILVYSSPDQVICSKRLESLTQSGIAQSLRAIRVRAKAIPDTGVRMDSILVHLDGGESSGTVHASLRYDSGDSTCRGNLFAPLQSGSFPGGSVQAWINVLGNGGRRIGVSDTAKLGSTGDTLRFDSAFRTSNALPNGTITGDTIRVVNTDYDLGLVLNRRHLGIRKYEWDLGDGKGFLPGQASAPIRWTDSGKCKVCTRVTDEDGNIAISCKPISVLSRDSIEGLGDRTGVAGDEIYFNLNVYDKDGVVRVVYDFGDGVRDSVTGSGPLMSGHHAYPMIPASAGETSHQYTLTVTVVDRRGNRTSRTAKITITNPLTSIVVMNTVGEIGTRLMLQARLLNHGSIATVEWNVAGSGYKAGRADTTIELPSLPTDGYPVLVRVTDSLGNHYAVDSVRVRVLTATRITDARDGQKYRITTIGSQTWMAQNLNYRNPTGSKDTVGICAERDSASCAKYGRLYTWSQAMGVDSTYNSRTWPGSTAKRQGICPQGWHVPSNAEWQKLLATAGGLDIAGGRLKATAGWNDDCKCGAGTDDYWFSAYPSTRYEIDGRLLDIGEGAYWWTTTQDPQTKYGMYVTDYRTFYMNPQLIYSSTEKSNFESLRCLKD